jgi:hypothetical protein
VDCIEFIDILRHTRAPGRLGCEVDLQRIYDIGSISKQIAYCREHLGDDAICGTWGNWQYNDKSLWSWAPGPIFYFDNMEDAVVFRLLFT